MDKPEMIMLEDLESARKNRERIEQSRLAEKARKETKEQPTIKSNHIEPSIEPTEIVKGQRHGDPSPLHYKKVDEKIDTIISLTKSGNGIRKTSRDTNVAINTVRKVVREGRASDQLRLELGLLKDDEVKAFTQDYQKRASQYSSQYKYEANFDAYMEILIERTGLENITKMLKHWIKYLDALQDCQHTRGAKLVLSSLSELCTIVNEMRPKENE